LCRQDVEQEVNIRMMSLLTQEIPGRYDRERLQDEVERITPERVEGHLQEGECEPGRISGGSG